MKINWASYGLRKPDESESKGTVWWVWRISPRPTAKRPYYIRWLRLIGGRWFVEAHRVFEEYPTIESAAAHLRRLGCGAKGGE